MQLKKLIIIVTIFLSIVSKIAIADSDDSNEPVLLDWLDLVPQHEIDFFENFDFSTIDHSGDGPPEFDFDYGNVKKELDNTFVKIPGFIIPLEGDNNSITDFLLVPYFGACIHVPPPPPNQIIYVRFENGAPIKSLWDVIYVIGTLKTETIDSELGEAGYVINGIDIENYEY